MNETNPLKQDNNANGTSTVLELEIQVADDENNKTVKQNQVKNDADLVKEVGPKRSQSGGKFESAEEIDLKYGAAHIIRIFIPVIICMILVVISVNLLPFYGKKTKNSPQFAQTPYREEDKENLERVGVAMLNAGIMILFVVFVTFALIVLYIYKCYCVLVGWIVLSSCLLLYVFSTIYLFNVLMLLNVPLDLPSAFMFIWNYACVGFVSIFMQAPLILQQGYLISISGLMALTFIKFLPDWTAWAVLIFISFWDLLAVLHPRGPLRVLVETAKERDEKMMPALIYSSFAHIYVANQADANVEKSKSKGALQRKSSDNPVKSLSSTSVAPGVKLGLGDFIFYSVLIGKSSIEGDWNNCISCFVAILVGLAATLMLLAIYKMALPALPISILCAIVLYFGTKLFVQSFAATIYSNLIFI